MNVPIPTNFATMLATSTSTFMGSMSAPAYVIIGILVAFLIVDILIRTFARAVGNPVHGVSYVRDHDDEE